MPRAPAPASEPARAAPRPSARAGTAPEPLDAQAPTLHPSASQTRDMLQAHVAAGTRAAPDHTQPPGYVWHRTTRGRQGRRCRRGARHRGGTWASLIGMHRSCRTSSTATTGRTSAASRWRPPRPSSIRTTTCYSPPPPPRARRRRPSSPSSRCLTRTRPRASAPSTSARSRPSSTTSSCASTTSARRPRFQSGTGTATCRPPTRPRCSSTPAASCR